jgi:hypothetical protein
LEEPASALSQQADHIFVTQKVVDEVRRNKIKETAIFLTKDFKELAKSETYNVPDHLFGATEDQSKSIVRQMSEIRQKIKQVNTEVRALALDIMTKVSQSTDEVSTALAPIFAKAVCHSDAQLQKAKERKERGDPPGKQQNPIGDQVTWEQILCRFVGKTKLWIITRDSDYGSMYGGKGFFNQFLYDELLKVSLGAEPFFFENIPDAIEHFADITGVKADELPTPEQREEIKKDEALLPLGPPAASWVEDDRYMPRAALFYTRPVGNYLEGYAVMQGVPSGETPIVARVTEDDPSSAGGGPASPGGLASEKTIE